MLRWTKKIQFCNYTGFNWIVIFIFGMMALTTSVFIITYRLALMGQEEVAVPNLISKELPEAIQELQAKNLNSNVTLRFSENAFDAGRVIDQEPKAGFILRAGRKVSLIVSRGVVLGIVPNFVGQNIEDVRNQISLLYSKTRPLMVIANPMVVLNEAPVGTILSQDPAPGVEISSLVEMNFRVSGGKLVGNQTPVASYVGLTYEQALQNLFDNRLSFHFILDNNLKGEGGIILAQIPKEGEYVGQNGISLFMKTPVVETGARFVLVESTLPSYPVFVKLDVYLEESNNGRSNILYSFYTKGGRLVLPAVVREGSFVELKVFGKSIDKLKF